MGLLTREKPCLTQSRISLVRYNAITLIYICSGRKVIEKGCGAVRSNFKGEKWARLPWILIASLFLTVAFSRGEALGGDISFDQLDGMMSLSGDLSELEKIYQPRIIENAKDYRLPQDARLIQETRISGGLRLLLAGNGLSKNGRFSGVQLLFIRAAEKEGKKESVLQRLNLGGGEAPQMRLLTLEGGRRAVFFRIMREDRVSEAFVFSMGGGNTPKLTERLRVDKNFPLRMRLNVKGTLMSGGFVDVLSVKPDRSERLDLSSPGAADELILAGLYGENGEPIAATRNLVCVRIGSEGVDVASGDKIQVGLSLVSSSRKRVVDVTATLESADGEKWDVSSLDFEPFLPFRSE